MTFRLKKRWRLALGVVATAGLLAWFVWPESRNDLLPPSETPAGLGIPRVYDDQAMASIEVPLAHPEASPVQISSAYYYRIGVRPIYKSYPIYHPDKEPPGYIEWLQQQTPETAFDTADLKTSEDWIEAGEQVFEAPTAYGNMFGFSPGLYVRDPEWQRAVRPPLLHDGVMPGMRYFVREKGKIEIGMFSCAMCHSRVMPDGSLVKGAQGNFPFDRALAWDYERLPVLLGPLRSPLARAIERFLYGAPWLGPADPSAESDRMSFRDIAAMHRAIPPGVLARHGTNPLRPSKVPDLIGIKDRRYLDATGLVQHREIGDLMRYAAMNQDTDPMATYLGKSPGASLPRGETPEDPADVAAGRYSDEQLYALALYIYSLKPPPNPNRFDGLAAAGMEIFERESCASCHPPPLYTSNKLTPAKGFTPPAEHLTRYDVLTVSVGTDPDLSLKTRRGTGYYKAPSLKGVWYRGPFEHNGSVLTLEDWFDPRRLRDDYVPTGFKGYNVKTRPVPGHPFGLDLTAEEKRSLIAFLKTL